MARRSLRTGLALAPLAALAGVAAAGTDQATPARAHDAPFACAIESERAGGMTTIRGVASSDTAISGSYRLSVDGGGGAGSARISQGGAFSAAPRAPAALGRVTLSDGVYEVRLALEAAGETVICEALVGGRV
ncbi:curli-like amyloid fiber formation chaperone CsgH [Aquibium sp. A9E412]|uniref:curli-like amyloid fiber formation chaperone CsgH n=1 Tax=Aquibium sp. A9E412 TaxID=2976767 RepID=UPI0025AEFBD3|nr:curli-like amyloid fiber formation chaperone CsgH [Aquibium sp. A9E412]MDN2566853.1 curli-like amyloid fiber formation chaperone CsgH [Aquibium sp. A9E412]